MAKLSKDILDEIEAENAIKAIQDVKELQAFIRGERREPLLDIAAYRLNVLKAPKPDESMEATGPAVPEIPAEAALVTEPGEILPTHDKDTTRHWVKTLAHLQPKQGEVDRITQQAENAGLKGEVVQKESKTKIMTLRDGKAVWVHFDEEGTEIKIEPIA